MYIFNLSNDLRIYSLISIRKTVTINLNILWKRKLPYFLVIAIRFLNVFGLFFCYPVKL